MAGLGKGSGGSGGVSEFVFNQLVVRVDKLEQLIIIIQKQLTELPKEQPKQQQKVVIHNDTVATGSDDLIRELSARVAQL